MKIKNWQNKEIDVFKSKGGVTALKNPYDNFLKTEGIPWPPPEIVQKLYKSNHQTAFIDQNRIDSASFLSFYSDLQSIHSEDAITWSVFGTASYFDNAKRNRFIKDFFQSAGLYSNEFEKSEISLWRRMPHPHTLVSGGPEIDFLIQTGNTLVLGEAKWKSIIASSQGKNKQSDQIELRIEFLEKYGAKIYPHIEKFAIIVLGLSDASLSHYDSDKIKCFSFTWEKVCALQSHLHSEELLKYLSWKKRHSKGV